jgi:hypothetical protein
MVTASFIDQALKDLTKTHHMDLLEKYQAVSKDGYPARPLEVSLMPLFDLASSVAVVVTAPSKLDQISDKLNKAGFVVDLISILRTAQVIVKVMTGRRLNQRTMHDKD